MSRPRTFSLSTAFDRLMDGLFIAVVTRTLGRRGFEIATRVGACSCATITLLPVIDPVAVVIFLFWGVPVASCACNSISDLLSRVPVLPTSWRQQPEGAFEIGIL